MSDLSEEVRKMTGDKDSWGDSTSSYVEFIVQTCIHYSEVLGHDPVDVFKALETSRTYSYQNYYQEANFPRLDGVVVFKNKADMLKTVQPENDFRCSVCGCVSKSPYVCAPGLMSTHVTCMSEPDARDFRFVIADSWLEKTVMTSIFMPMAMEGNARVKGYENDKQYI